MPLTLTSWLLAVPMAMQSDGGLHDSICSLWGLQETFRLRLQYFCAVRLRFGWYKLASEWLDMGQMLGLARRKGAPRLT